MTALAVFVAIAGSLVAGVILGRRRFSTALSVLVLAVIGYAVGWAAYIVIWPATDEPAETTSPCPCVERFRPGSWDCSGAVEWTDRAAAEAVGRAKRERWLRAEGRSGDAD